MIIGALCLTQYSLLGLLLVISRNNTNGDDATNHNQLHDDDDDDDDKKAEAAAAAPLSHIKTVQQQQQQQQQYPESSSLPKNRLYYVGQFGLGHRLSKLSAAFHLLVSSSRRRGFRHHVAELEIHWGSCQTRQHDIFAFLFGTHVLSTTTSTTTSSLLRQQQQQQQYSNETIAQMNHRQQQQQQQQGKTILVRNDVHGYYAGQSYKNVQVPIPKYYGTNPEDHHHHSNSSSSSSTSTSPWLEKLLHTDEIFFQTLLQRFLKLHPAVRDFQLAHHWYNRTVVGLHLRAGNGEQDHFVQSGRNSNSGVVLSSLSSSSVTNNNNNTNNNTTGSTVLVQNLCRLLHDHVWPSISAAAATTTTRDHRKPPLPLPLPPLLFVATDTPDLIPVVQEACRPTFAQHIVVLPQPRLEPFKGVSYSAWKSGPSCFQGWLASMMDMALLSMSNIVIAGMRSTFTQIMPLSLVLMKKKPKQQQHHNDDEVSIAQNQFCEVSKTGRTMTCFRHKAAWLFRNMPAEQDTFTLDADPGTATATATTVSTYPHPVVHKVMVHLPDLQWSELTQEMFAFLDNVTAINEKRVYGSRIDKTYRQRPNADKFREEWTWEEE